MTPASIARRFNHWPLGSLLAFLMAAMVATAAASDDAQRPSGDPAFILEQARLERLVNGHQFGMVFTEGPAIGCDGLLYFSDIAFSSRSASYTSTGILAGAIWVYDPAIGQPRVFRSPSGMSNGLIWDAECRLVAAEGADHGGRRITRTNMQTGIAEIIAAEYDGKPFNAPNDLVMDAQGRLYFTDTRFVGQEDVYHPNAVYMIDTDGVVVLATGDVGAPNGIAISPDQRTLYVVERGLNDFSNPLPMDFFPDYGQPGIYAYDLDTAGKATFREVLVPYGEDGADGLAVDEEGNIWAAVQDGERPGIYVYTPNGVQKGYIPTPRPSNLTFGRGSERNVLYITALKHVYRITVGKQGYRP